MYHLRHTGLDAQNPLRHLQHQMVRGGASLAYPLVPPDTVSPSDLAALMGQEEVRRCSCPMKHLRNRGDGHGEVIV